MDMCRPNTALLHGTARLMAVVLASGCLAAAAHGEALTLRPAFTEVSYIHVDRPDPLSSDFVRIIAGAVAKADVVEAAAARWHASRHGVDAARGAELPSGAFFGEVGVASGSAPNPYSYGVRVSVPLFDNMSASQATASQQAISDASYETARDELAATLVDLVAAAASMRRASESLDVRRGQLTSVENLLSQIIGEQSAGLASRVDREQIEAQLAQLDITVNEAQAARISAIEAFESIAGAAPAHIGSIGSIRSQLPQNEQDGLVEALRNNPKLAERIDLASAAQLKARSLAAASGPNLSLDLSAGMRGDVYNTVPATTEMRAVFKLEVPFAFGTDAAIQQSHLIAQAANFEINASRLGVAAGLKSAYLRLSTLRSSLSVARDSVQRALSIRTGIVAERTLGQRTVSDVLSAEGALADARIRLLNLEYDAIVTEHLIAAQIGAITDIYGVSLK